ncbi:MAG: HesA/MoeB/ThiF family protein [Candidatus Aureabacteria bacterium]|nr:HesA/MoeB/ThiF family protein [Candidatus Auribacterota bacterium]
MSVDIASRVSARAREITDSLGHSYRGLTLFETARHASVAGCLKKEVEIAALQSGIIPCRYYRNIPALGRDGQMKLLSSRAAVVGAGGLGGYIIEILSRLGVGTLVVIDGEVFSEDNLNRQILCRESDLGRKKALVAAERVAAVNSSIETIAHPIFLTGENAEELIGPSQVAVDALDRIDARILLEKAAAKLKIPLVHGAIGGFLGEVTTVFPGEGSLESLYGKGRAADARGVESVLGTPSPTPAVVGSLQAVEVLKILLGRGTPFHGKLLYLELENGDFSEISLGSRE